MTGRLHLLLLTGPTHSGKTTAAAALAQRARTAGMRVAGILAEGVRRGGVLVGFDAVDIATGRRAALAYRRNNSSPGQQHVGEFVFLDDGLALGTEALSPPAVSGADLVIVDEFGPLELGGGGWRGATDELLASQAAAAVLLVVRDKLASAVKQLYAAHGPRLIDAASAQDASIASLLAGADEDVDE